jgi:hypothetical protein
MQHVSRFLTIYVSGISGSAFWDYISLWKTRYAISVSRKVNRIFLNLLFLIIDIISTLVLAACAALTGETIFLWLNPAFNYDTLISIDHAVRAMWFVLFPTTPEMAREVQHLFWNPVNLGGIVTVYFIPAFFGRLWFLTYVGCGLLLKAARRLDIGFSWFNRCFDVENNPLQCIGLVAGTLSAVLYWLLAVIHLLP